MKNTKSTKLGDAARFMLGEISEGRNRVFFRSLTPSGWRQVEKLGLATRVEGTDRAELTEAGRRWCATGEV